MTLDFDEARAQFIKKCSSEGLPHQGVCQATDHDIEAAVIADEPLQRKNARGIRRRAGALIHDVE